jgi:hypothetical protein
MTTPAPVLPAPRGPLSSAVLDLLRAGVPATGRPAGTSPDPAELVDLPGTDPYGEDLQLALYCCYELHYRGFDGVADDREWDPALLTLRGAMERVFLSALRADVKPGTDVDAEVAGLLDEPDAGPDGTQGPGVSHHLLREGELWQLREYVVHRSTYHLKEGDPQAWVIPRMVGAAKSGLVAVEHDEYGAGVAEHMHARLFAEMMTELGLSDTYGEYLDAVGAQTLAEVNFMSMCGLRRSLRGALVGQFATVELTSSPGSDRLVRAMRRLGCGDAAIRFYDEHAVADAVHEQTIRRRVLAPMLAAEPNLAPDVVFGMRASSLLADQLADMLLACWGRGESSLRAPLRVGTPVSGETARVIRNA